MNEERTIPDDELIEINGGLDAQIDLFEVDSRPGSAGRGRDAVSGDGGSPAGEGKQKQSPEGQQGS